MHVKNCEGVVMLKYLMLYLIVINLLSFYLMAKDKKAAIQHRWRVPEKVLFFVTLIGGSVGGLAGMIHYHHKNRKWYFLFGYSIIFALHLFLFLKLFI